MGTPDFAVATLEALVQNQYTVVGVITAPDRPAGRGQKLHESAVKKYAVAKGLEVLQPKNLKDESFLQSLTELKANLQIVVAFRMLPKVVWQMPAYGTFNLHASLLPDYRGAAPINWAVINGEVTTGVTTFFIDEKIDTGAIILQKECPISENDTAGILHDKLMTLGAELVITTTKLVQENKVVAIDQKNTNSNKMAPKISRDTCEVNWNHNAELVYNHIRGLSPYPTAWTTLHTPDDTLYLKIYDVELERIAHNLEPGVIVADKWSMKIAAKGGYIHMLQIQLPGKRKMAIKDVLNGLNLDPKAYVA